MKFHANRDRDSRYQSMVINSSDPFFEARIDLTFPSPAYKYELSDEELTNFAKELMLEWHEIYENKINKLLAK